MKNLRWAAALAVGVLLISSCHNPGGDGDDEAAPVISPASMAVPVQTALVRTGTLQQTVTAPGHTVALSQLKIRAPFAGTLKHLRVTDGDAVARGEAVATIISRDSEAALSGAEAMRREAATPEQKADADRALELARRNLIRKALISPWGGTVVTHSAAAGDRVAEGQDILTISAAGSLIFEADVAQVDLPKVRAGQSGKVLLAGESETFPARVHGILSSANSADLTVPVRLDFLHLPARIPVGLFGTAAVTVGVHAEAHVVPAAAVIRDDVSGVSRLAVVGPGNVAHWIIVRTGLAQGGSVEIVSPELADGTRVIIEGQVGLPDGAAVVVRK